MTDLPDIEDAIVSTMCYLEEQILSLNTNDARTHDLKLMHFTLSRTLDFVSKPLATSIQLT